MKYLSILFLIFLWGCSPQASVDALPDAKKVVEGFFENFKKGRYEEVTKMYSEKFWEIMPKDTWLVILPNIRKKLGALDTCELVTWSQKTSATTNGSGNFVSLQYNCSHEKYESTMSFSIYKPLSGGKSEIIGHNVNSIGFLIE